VGLVAYIAFLVIGTERLRLDRHLLLAAVGLASVAVMMPVLGDYTVRVFAAAVPFLALAVALAVAVIERIPLRASDATMRASVQKSDTRAARWAPIVLGVSVAAVAVIGAPIAAVVVDKPPTPARICPDGRRAEPLIAASTVRLVANQGEKGQLDEVRASRVTSAPPIRMLQDRGVFGPIRAGTTIVGGVTEQEHDRVAFVDGSISVPRNSVLYLCGAPVSTPDSNPVLKEWFLPLDVFAGYPIGSVAVPSTR
jgi:ribosomal protein S28E/S33